MGEELEVGAGGGAVLERGFVRWIGRLGDFLDDLPAVVLLMQTDAKSDGQSDEAGDDKRCYETDPPPSSSPRNTCIVSHFAQFFSFGTCYIP